jgi:hypothetical protein
MGLKLFLIIESSQPSDNEEYKSNGFENLRNTRNLGLQRYMQSQSENSYSDQNDIEVIASSRRRRENLNTHRNNNRVRISVEDRSERQDDRIGTDMQNRPRNRIQPIINTDMTPSDDSSANNEFEV